jgi:DUF4097 and DUF4098 domain-containing protein YvlB
MHDNARYSSISLSVLIFTIITVFCGVAGAQAPDGKAAKATDKGGSTEFCSNWNNRSGDRVGHRELREFKIPSTGRLEVDSGRNGGVSVNGGEVGDVSIKACVNTSAATVDLAREVARNITIETSGTIKAENAIDESDWGVSFLITVPRNTDLKLRANNGGIAISGVDGRLEFETKNGGINLSDTAGDVRGRTTNGGVAIVLSGTGWRGTGLDVATTNGGISIMLPTSYSANIETGTVNGGFKSDIPELNITTEELKGGWEANSQERRVITAINGGGAPIRVVTKNGGVKINASKSDLRY